MGLAIANSIIEHVGGTITLTSEPDVGTHVTVTLPRAPLAPGTAAP